MEFTSRPEILTLNTTRVFFLKEAVYTCFVLIFSGIYLIENARADCLNINSQVTNHLTHRTAKGSFGTSVPGALGKYNGMSKVVALSTSLCMDETSAWWIDEPEASTLPHTPFGKSISYAVTLPAGPASVTYYAILKDNRLRFLRRFEISSDQYKGTYYEVSKSISIYFDGHSCRVLDYTFKQAMGIRFGGGLGNFYGVNAKGNGGSCGITK